jgi:hypothetical protein
VNRADLDRDLTRRLVTALADPLDWRHLERRGGLARVDGVPGMYVRCQHPDAKWYDRREAPGGGDTGSP